MGFAFVVAGWGVFWSGRVSLPHEWVRTTILPPMIKIFRFICAILLAVSISTAAESGRPHVIVIMTDDQGGWDYGFMGNSVVKTPHLDAMAARGAHMTRFYVSPVCTPTRANLMTGRYNYRTRAIDTYIGRAMMDTEEVY